VYVDTYDANGRSQLGECLWNRCWECLCDCCQESGCVIPSRECLCDPRQESVCVIPVTRVSCVIPFKRVPLWSLIRTFVKRLKKKQLTTLTGKTFSLWRLFLYKCAYF